MVSTPDEVKDQGAGAEQTLAAVLDDRQRESARHRRRAVTTSGEARRGCLARPRPGSLAEQSARTPIDRRASSGAVGRKQRRIARGREFHAQHVAAGPAASPNGWKAGPPRRLAARWLMTASVGETRRQRADPRRESTGCDGLAGRSASPTLDEMDGEVAFDDDVLRETVAAGASGSSWSGQIRPRAGRVPCGSTPISAA